MLGCHNGVAEKLKERSPLLIENHCVLHRLNLAYKDSDKLYKEMEDYNKLLKDLFKFLRKSPKKILELKEYQELRKDKTFKILKFYDILWLSKYNCVDNLRKSYGAILDLLEEYAKQKDAPAKTIDLYNSLKDYKTIFYTYALSDLLNIMANTFKNWQSNSVGIKDVLESLGLLRAYLDDEYIKVKISNEIGGIHYNL